MLSNPDQEFFAGRLKYFKTFENVRSDLFEAVQSEEYQKNLCTMPRFLHPVEINLLNYETNLDVESNEVLKTYKLDHLQAVRPAGEGSSLFDAISLCLYGNRKFTQMIQYLTGIWFAKTRALKTLYPKYSTEDDFQILKSILIPGHATGALTLLAVVNALNIAITSVYPPHNGLFDVQFSMLNTTFYPIFHDPKYEKIKRIHIMWAGAYQKLNGGKSLWVPDHFVSVFDSSVEPPVKVEPVGDGLPDDGYVPKSKKPRYSDSEDPSMEQEEGGTLAIKSANVMVSPGDLKKFVPRFKNAQKNGVELIVPKAEKVGDEVVPPLTQHLHISTICGVTGVYEHLKSCTTIYKTIPKVSDDGCQFVMRLKTKNLHIDDGHDWNIGKGIFYHYHFLKSTFERIYHVGEVFCCQESVSSRSFVPMNPQPEKSDYIETMILVAYHSSSPWFYRKITIIEDSALFGILAYFQYSPRNTE